jgi:hypothetical protein
MVMEGNLISELLQVSLSTGPQHYVLSLNLGTSSKLLEPGCSFCALKLND